MVTIRDSHDYITNDNNKPILVSTPDGRYGGEDDTEAQGVEFCFTSSANIKPGTPVFRATGADGEDTVTETSGGEARAYGIAGLDKSQIKNCTVAYDQGDKIPILPFHKFLGSEMRNIRLADPGGNVDVDTPLGAGSAAMQTITEATLATGATVDGFNTSATAIGQFGASGAYIHNREFMRNKYYIADPDSEARIVAYIARA